MTAKESTEMTKRLYLDIESRIRSLRNSIIGVYFDYCSENDNVLVKCHNAVLYAGACVKRFNIEEALTWMDSINCGLLQPRSEEYEEILTAYLDQWFLDIVGIKILLKFLLGNEINQDAIANTIRNARVDYFRNIVIDQANLEAIKLNMECKIRDEFIHRKPTYMGEPKRYMEIQPDQTIRG